jgi:enoyl-CoA hydratase
VADATGTIGVDVDDDAVMVLTIDRPAKLNAVTPSMAAALLAALRDAEAREDVRAVVLTGAGERAFCAGSDVTSLDAYPTPWAFRNRQDYCDALRGCALPVIAAINGWALGGGLELALSADVRLAAATARMGAPEVKLGWIGGGGMSALLTHSIGASNAALMLMTGDPVDAATALRWGLVSEVVEPAELLPRARALAATIASRAPIAVATAKTNLRAAHGMSIEDAIRYERDLQTICLATADADEGRAAFAERREARFSGR